MAEVRGFRTAFFIDTEARRLTPGLDQPHSWHINASRPAFWCKTALLWATLALVGTLVETATSGRACLVLLCTLLFVLRVQAQMTFFWRRAIPWKEVVFESGGIIPLSFASLGLGCVPAALNVASWVSFALFVLGTWVNVWPELQRHRWKSDAREAKVRVGKLYTGSLFRHARHINYTGEILSFVGLALLTGSWWTLWVPACMGAGMATFSVWEIEFYLSQRYAAEWPSYCKQTPWLLVPGLY